MKPTFIGLIFFSTAATAFAQIARPILPPGSGSPTTGALTMSGCVSVGGVDESAITMMRPTIRSTIARGGVSTLARPITIPPVTITPMYLPPDTSYEPSAVATTGTSAVEPVATAGISPTNAGPVGYRLTGSDMSSWVGRRVQVTGNVVPPDPEAVEVFPEIASFPQFDVHSVVPLTGGCPQ